MNFSIKDLAISAIFIITISTVISNIYRPKLGLIYALVNIVVLTLFSLYKDSWTKNQWNNLLLLISKEIG